MKKSKKKVRKELVCEKCLKDLQPNQLYCYECGQPTAVLSEELSAKKNWVETWGDYKQRKGENYPFAIFFIFIILIPQIFIILLPKLVFSSESTNTYLINNLIYLFTLPLIFIPFATPLMAEKAKLTIRKYFQDLKHYPRMFLFVLINLVYFFLLKMITSSVDPILNLVRLIMVLYWLAIIVPYPHLLLRKKINPLQGLIIVYKVGKETRWQQFFTYIYLFVINILGLAALGIGLLVTIPYSIAVLERYYLQMDKLDLFEQVQASKPQVTESK